MSDDDDEDDKKKKAAPKGDYWEESKPMPTLDRLGDDPYLGLPVAERVVKYKEEGNKLLNKDTEKAVLWYTRAIQAPHNVPEDRAVFYANRCAAHLLIRNFRSALEDAETALELNPNVDIRMKLLYRASRAAFGSEKYPLALKYVKQGLDLKKTPELIKLEEDIHDAVKKELRRQDKVVEKQDDKKEMVKLFQQALMQRGWRLSSTFMYQTVFSDNKTIGVQYSDKQDEVFFPVVLMYPEYRQSELLQGVSEHDTLLKWFYKLFPPNSPPVGWDTNGHFLNARLQEIVVLAKTNDYPQNTQMRKWIQMDPSKKLGEIFLSNPEYVIPKWPTFFLVHQSYADKFKGLDINKIN